MPHTFFIVVCWLFGHSVCMTIVPSKVEMLARNPKEYLLKPHVVLMFVPSNPKPPTIVNVLVMHVETKSSNRAIPREELHEDIEPLSYMPSCY